MDEKKVKEAIEYVSKMVDAAKEVSESTGWIVHKENYEKLKTTLKALEKQLPKKVENRTEYRNLYGHLIFYKGFCPSCGRVVESYRNLSCHVCTQRLDWSEDRKVKE